MRKCRRCGKEAKYLRPETGLVCKSCRIVTAPIGDDRVCWLVKPCSMCKEEKALESFPIQRSKKDGRKAQCSQCLRITRNRLLDSWYDAIRGNYSGTLEEYAEHRERAQMGCHANAWRSWEEQPKPELHRLRTRAIALDRPVRNPATGRMVWPSGWNSAKRFAWRYEHDEEFRRRQVMRTKVRKYTNPSYAGSSEMSAGNRRKWERAFHQLGKVTRRHIRRESVAKFCSYCLDPLTASNRHLDHVIPLSGGGLHDNENIIACCSSCNQSKGTKLLINWLVDRNALNQKQFGVLGSRYS